MRLKPSVGTYGRTPATRGVVWTARSGRAAVPSAMAAGSCSRGSGSTRGVTTTVVPGPTVAYASNRPSGSPVRMTMGSIR